MVAVRSSVAGLVLVIVVHTDLPCTRMQRGPERMYAQLFTAASKHAQTHRLSPPPRRSTGVQDGDFHRWGAG